MTPYAQVVSQMGSLSTRDYKIPSNTNIFGDLSQNAMQSQSAMNSAQMGQKNSNQLQSALSAIQENLGSELDVFGRKKSASQMEQDLLRLRQPPQRLGEREVRDPVALETLKTEQKYFQDYQTKLAQQEKDLYKFQEGYNPIKEKERVRLKDEQYIARRLAGGPQLGGTQPGTGSELLPSGQVMSEMAQLSTRINSGQLLGLIPTRGSVGKKEDPAPVTDSSNILPYGSYVLKDNGEKQYVTMKMSPEQAAQRKWEQASQWDRKNLPHPLGGYGAYDKSRQTTPDGRKIYH
jgi:hypothetical protein